MDDLSMDELSMDDLSMTNLSMDALSIDGVLVSVSRQRYKGKINISENYGHLAEK